MAPLVAAPLLLAPLPVAPEVAEFEAPLAAFPPLDPLEVTEDPPGGLAGISSSAAVSKAHIPKA